MPAPALTDAQITALAGGGSAGSDTQLVQGGDGNWYLVNKSSGVVTPVQGIPAKDGSTSAPKTVRDPNTGIIYSVNPDGTLTAQTDASQKPVETVPGTGSPGTPDYSGASAGGSDPSGPAMVGATPDVSVAVNNSQTTAKNDEAARRIAQQNADTAAANSAETAKQNAIQNARQAAQDAWSRGQADISNQLAQGRLSLDQAQLAASNLHAQISEDLQRSSQALTARGQNLDYLGRQSFVTAGQYGALQDAEAGAARSGGVSFTPSPTPPSLGYDPSQIGAMLAKQVLGQTQIQGFSMGGAPAAASGTGFVPPNLEQGGLQTNNPAVAPLSVGARR